MAVSNIPDDHHVLRHCKSRLVRRVDGVVRGVFPELFHLRPGNETRKQETYLSSLYYEYFTADRVGRLKSCCEYLAFEPRPKDAMALLNAGRIRAEGAKKKLTLRVTHEPKKHNEAYAAIRGIPTNTDDELSNALALVATIEAIEMAEIK